VGRLVRTVVTALVVVAIYSVVKEIWRATNFDSEFTGLVQRAISGDPTLAERALELAADKGITLVESSFIVTPAGGRTEVTVRYSIPIGLGSLSYRWERGVSAFTEGAAPFGVPLSGAQAPSTPAPGPSTMGLPSRVSKSLRDAQGR